jgi:hypothetical protein
MFFGPIRVKHRLKADEEHGRCDGMGRDQARMWQLQYCVFIIWGKKEKRKEIRRCAQANSLKPSSNRILGMMQRVWERAKAIVSLPSNVVVPRSVPPHGGCRATDQSVCSKLSVSAGGKLYVSPAPPV